MYNETQAKEKVLELVNKPGRGHDEDEFVISSIRLSENRDYWVVHANSKAYVEFGDSSRCYVGVGAYMVDSITGQIEIVGSAESPEQFIQDKYDLKKANGKSYILTCNHDIKDKKAIVNIHQVFNCPLNKAKYLLRENRNWFSGKKRHLEQVQSFMNSKGIKTEIKLADLDSAIASINSEVIWWEAMEKIIANDLLI